jgi:hypothetical protein
LLRLYLPAYNRTHQKIKVRKLEQL